jgi:hypothetical protein
MLHSKLTRGKFYIMLFGIIAICYVVFATVKMFSSKNGNFEHFEDASYTYRMEVMKVFDLYLKRNPTSEEIDKYSALKNEHDILTKILTDFNISAVDVDKAKLVESETKTVSDAKEPVAVTTPVDTPVVAPSVSTAPESEKFEDGKKKMVCIPKESYEELKTLLLSLQAKIEEKEF